MKTNPFKGLDCSAPADDMIQLVLRGQLKAMCALRRRALDWDNPEGVHDMRVRSRRLRSAISDFEPHLRKHALPVARLRAIAKSLGAVRDQDVAIAALSELKSDAHGKLAEGIELFIEERRQRREAARDELKKNLQRSLVNEFSGEFESKVQGLGRSQKKSTTPGPVPSYADLGERVIAERLQEFRQAGPQIFSPFRTKDLHELRILAKRLRYALELFQPCGESELKDIARKIASLQTALGELHDCDVWIEDLGTRLQNLTGRPESQIGLIDAACAWLLTRFVKERTQHYRKALQLWMKWEADGFLNQILARGFGVRPRT